MTILVAYASKHGSTEQIAHAIARRLAERGLGTDVRRVSGIDTIEPYDAVVLGSAVYAGAWMRDASAFVRMFSVELSSRPAWLFSSGPLDGGREHGLSDRQRAELDAAIHPRGHRVFGGRLELAELGFLERRIVKMVQASPGDHRDFEQIRAFADAIADALSITAA